MRWAAAALLVVGLGAGFWLRMESQNLPVAATDRPAPETNPERDAILAEVERMEAVYQAAFAELKRSLKDADDVPPDALQAIVENLRIIDGAIEMTRVALHKDPNNRALMRLLVSVYKTKKQTLVQGKLPTRS
jgi:hypothetical protein